MLRKKGLWIGLIALAVLGGGGVAAYKHWFAPRAPAEGTAALQTATATRGSISLTAAGSGTLVAADTANLAFSASSAVEEILVKVGDHVQAGDVLARANDDAARQALAEAEQAVIDAEIEVALATGQAELAVAKAEAELEAAREALDALVAWDPDSVELAQAKAGLASAQAAYQTTAAKASMVDQQNASVRISLDQAISALANAQQSYAEAMNPERDWEKGIEDSRTSTAAALVRAQQNLELAQADYDLAMADTSASSDVQNAWAQVLSAREAVADLEEEPTGDEIAAAERAVKEAQLTLQQAQLELGNADQAVAQRRAELALEQARMNLAVAQETVDGMVLTAPFAGTVVQVAIEVGEVANGTAIVLSNLDTPVIEFWVDESDMSSVALGNPVSIVFSALPELTYSGEIYQIDPEMVTVGNTPAVQAWATIDTSAHAVTLLGGMNADVDIVAGEATDAVLVPVEALRTIGEEQHAVFVVQPDGSLEMRVVEVGLSDYVNAEIRSGLEADEVVSVGDGTSAAAAETTTDEEGFPPGGMMFEGGAMPGGGMMPGGGRP